MQRFRGGLEFNADRLVYHSALGLTVMKKKKTDRRAKRKVSSKWRLPVEFGKEGFGVWSWLWSRAVDSCTF